MEGAERGAKYNQNTLNKSLKELINTYRRPDVEDYGEFNDRLFTKREKGKAAFVSVYLSMM